MQRPYFRLVILLLIALPLLANAACAGNSPPSLPTPRDAAATQTAEPTQPASATETSAPTTEQPTPTVEQPTPTTEQPTPTVEQPRPTAEQTAGQSEILVMVDLRVLAAVEQDGTVRMLDVPQLDTQTFQVVGSLDGGWLAGPTDEMGRGVTIYNVKSGATQLLENQGGTVGSFSFSPDSTQLLFMVKDTNTDSWQLKTVDLASGEVSVVTQGAGEPAYQPLAWTPRGIVVTQVYLTMADATPEALHLLDPATGRVETILPPGNPYIMAEASRDGSKLAIVKGAHGLGMEHPTPSLEIVDLETGETTLVEPPAPGFIYDLRWSPGGARLIYARNPGGERAPAYTIAGVAGGAPMLIDLTAAPGSVKDVAWATDDSLLVLLAEGAEEKLYYLPATSTDASALRALAAIDSAGEDRGSVILSLGR